MDKMHPMWNKLIEGSGEDFSGKFKEMMNTKLEIFMSLVRSKSYKLETVWYYVKWKLINKNGTFTLYVSEKI